jgi:hypothetical protein
MNSSLYKFVCCLVMALCAVESIDYLINDVVPNSDIAFLGMTLSFLLLAERLYMILWIEHHIKVKK